MWAQGRGTHCSYHIAPPPEVTDLTDRLSDWLQGCYGTGKGTASRKGGALSRRRVRMRSASDTSCGSGSATNNQGVEVGWVLSPYA